MQTVAQQLVDVIRAVLAPYGLSEEDEIHAIRGLRSIVHGFIALEMANGFGMPVDTDASFQWLITMFIVNLAPSSSAWPLHKQGGDHRDTE